MNTLQIEVDERALREKFCRCFPSVGVAGSVGPTGPAGDCEAEEGGV